MEENKTSGTSVFRQAIRRNGGLFLAFVLLDAVFIWLYACRIPNSAGPTIVGVVREPLAYCVFAESGVQNARYHVVMEDGYADLIYALDQGELDAAILPVQYLGQLDPDEYVVMAVTASLNMVAVGNGATVYSLGGLNGRTVTVPESLRDSREMRMLDLLMAATKTEIQILYQSDDEIVQSALENEDEVLMLSPEQGAHLLLQSKVYKSYFTLAKQWELLLGTQPPAGSCIVARKTDMDPKTSGMSDFLADVKVSLEFINSKHKKASTFIAASGLSQDVAFVLKVLPLCAFRYLDGDAVAQALNPL